MSEKVKQQLHFVAFLDLLGYKDFFRKKGNDAEKFLETLDEAISSTIDETKYIYRKVPDNFKPQIKMFSDNILIAIKCTNRNEQDFLPYLNLVRTVAHIQKSFINKYQLFLRGGIAKGMFYFNERYVFGKALIEAYEMEQNAIYPKIKIDDSYFKKILKYVNENEIAYGHFAKLMIDVIGKERDGSYFVNYLPTYPWGKSDDKKVFINSIFSDINEFKDHSHDEKTYETMQAHKNALLKKITEYGSYMELFTQNEIDTRKKVILKYMWSLDYHNQVCKLLGLRNLIISCDVKIDARTLQPSVELINS